MMLNVASRGIKRVVRNIDWGFIESSVLRMYQHLRLYDLRPELRGGDIKIIARGSSALIAKDQQQVRRNEAMQAVLNPMVLQVIGLRGLAYVLREWFAGLDMDVDKIVPAEEEVLQMMQAQQQQQQALTMQRQQQPARQPRGRELDPAGNPVAGQDARLF
jgi:hypothetical protein